MVIPDTQVKPGVNTDHLEWAGRYAVKMKPDVIVHLGDHADFPSLSTWDKKGGRHMEGKRIMADFESANEAWARLNAPIDKEIARLKKGKRKAWNPRRVITLGNHEDRVTRFVTRTPRGRTLSVWTCSTMNDQTGRCSRIYSHAR